VIQADLANKQAAIQKMLEDFRETTNKRFEEINQKLNDSSDQATWFFALSVAVGVFTAIVASEEGRGMLKHARDTLLADDIPSIEEEKPKILPRGKGKVLENLLNETKDFKLNPKTDPVTDQKVRAHVKNPTAIFRQPEQRFIILPPVRKPVTVGIQVLTDNSQIEPAVYQRPADADRLAVVPYVWGPNYAPINVLTNTTPTLMIEYQQPPVPAAPLLPVNQNMNPIPRKSEMVPTGRSDLDQPSQKVAKLPAYVERQ
jgi:hypothetical protein